MPKRVSTRPQASNTDDTTIKFQYSFMSVPNFHDLSNNGTRTVLASSTVLMSTHIWDLSSITTVDEANAWATVWYWKACHTNVRCFILFQRGWHGKIFISGVSISSPLSFYMAYFSDLNVSSTTETALYNFIHMFGFRQTTYTHNPWNRNWTFTHVKNFSCKTTRKTRSEHCKTLTQKVTSMACASTVCTLTRYRMPVAEPWRGVAVSATREHTRTWVYSHAYQTHIHHTNTTYQTNSNLFWSHFWNQLISAYDIFGPHRGD